MSLDTVVLIAAVKGSILIVAAWMIMRALPRMSAALRHLVWASALGGLVLMPVLVRVVPSLQSRFVPAIPIVTSIQTRAVAGGPVAPAPAAASAAEQTVTPLADGHADLASTTPARMSAHRSIDLERWLPVAWALVAMALLLRIAFGRLRVALLARRASVVDDGDWLLLAQRLALRLDISRPITLLRSDRSCVPMTWGLVYPTVLLPIDADDWTLERRTIVLLHELAHVNRFDAFTQLIAQIATAVFWFNPLAWLAARAMRVERELACDDCVLAAGARPSDYAQDLLQIARSFSARSDLAVAALAMARRGDLEDRLMAILDPATDRSAVSRSRLAGAMAAIIGVSVPLAALSPAPVQAAELSLHTATTAVTPRPAEIAERPHVVKHAVPRSPTRSTEPDRETLLSVAQAATKLTSGYDKAELLVPIAKYYRADDALAAAYMTAAASIVDDYNCSRAIVALLGSNVPLGDKVIELAMNAAGTRVTSDYEKGNVIGAALGDGRVLGPDARRATIAAIGTITSSYARHTAISAFVKRRQFSEQDAIGLINVTAKITGSYDRAEALIDIAAHHGLDDAGVRQAYMQAVETITSSSDYRRAVEALVRRP
jgi:beta-lactamase regulating signal transducer with metallopeptidase domain